MPFRFVAGELSNNIWMMAQLSKADSFFMKVFQHPLIHFASCEEFAGVEFPLFFCILVGVLVGKANAFEDCRICAATDFFLQHIILYSFH